MPDQERKYGTRITTAGTTLITTCILAGTTPNTTHAPPRAGGGRGREAKGGAKSRDAGGDRKSRPGKRKPKERREGRNSRGGRR